MGVSRLVVQAILNRKDRSVTAVYDRWGAVRVETIAGSEPEGKVVEFRARGAV